MLVSKAFTLPCHENCTARCPTIVTWPNAEQINARNKEAQPKCYLSGQDAEEDEDEHPLEGVGDGEQIGSEGGLVEDVQHSKGPGGSQHEQQGHGTTGTGPGGDNDDFYRVWVNVANNNKKDLTAIW